MKRTILILIVAAVASPRPATAVLRNVRDYPSPAAAIAAAQDGDRIYFPSPGPYQAPPGGWKIDKCLEIFGDGIGNGSRSAGSTLIPHPGADNHIFTIDPSARSLSNIYFHDLHLFGTDSSTGDGIHATIRDTLHTISELGIDRVTCTRRLRDGIHLDGGPKGGLLIVHIGDCVADGCDRSGIDLRHCTTTYITGGYFHGCGRFGIYSEAAWGLRLLAVALEGNQIGGSSNDYDSQLRLKLTHAFTVIGCHFEEFSDPRRPPRTAITVENCWGGQVSTCQFIRNHSGVQGSRGIFVTDSSRDIMISANLFARIDTLVSLNVGRGVRGCTIEPENVFAADAHAAGILKVPDVGGNRRSVPVAPGIATLDLADQVGDLPPRVLTTAGGGGMYRVTVYARVTTPGSGAMTVRIAWNDGAAKTKDVITGLDPTVANNEADAVASLYLAPGHSITCQTLGVGGAAHYTLRIRAEPL